jgi:hypothetical protein
MLDCVYRAVAWHSVDQIRYSMNTIKEMENEDKENSPLNLKIVFNWN